MQEKNAESYSKIVEYEQQVHEKNQNRIRIGIKVLLLIPLLFLAIMFKMDSSKVVFLVLWIVSLFGIAFYLIGVEYMDYQLQIKLREFGIQEEDKPIQGLIEEDSRVEKIIVNAGLLDDDRPTRFRALIDKGAIRNVDEPAKEKEIVKPNPVAIVPAATKPQTNNVSVDSAEEELVQSIRKYIQAVNEQAKQEGTQVDIDQTMRVIGEVSKRSPENFAQMRKDRASRKREKE